MSCLEMFALCSLPLINFSHFRWLMSLLSPTFFLICFSKYQVEKTVRNGYKTTKSQLTASLNEITSQITAMVEPIAKQLSHEMLPQLIESNNAIKAITLYRQCERFLHDLLNTLSDQQIHIDRCLKNFRSQLHKIHEIVKFRTAIPITSIFVSMNTLFLM